MSEKRLTKAERKQAKQFRNNRRGNSAFYERWSEPNREEQRESRK